MRVLNGVGYMLKRIGPRTVPWGTPQERGLGGDVKPEARTEKERDKKVLNHVRAVSVIPNQNERRWWIIDDKGIRTVEKAEAGDLLLAYCCNVVVM